MKDTKATGALPATDTDPRPWPPYFGMPFHDIYPAVGIMLQVPMPEQARQRIEGSPDGSPLILELVVMSRMELLAHPEFVETEWSRVAAGPYALAVRVAS